MNQNRYSKFKHLLVDPYTKKTLEFNLSPPFFHNKNIRYTINKNVCVFIKPESKDTDQEFNYIDHYQKDGDEFDYSIDSIHKTTRYEIIKLHQNIISNIKPLPNITILDIGCGNGWVAKEFLKKGCNVISADISMDNTSRVIKKFPNDNHIAIIADAYHLPIKENSIDYIIASEIMEHVINPKLFIESLYKILKKGGRLIITTPYNEVIQHALCIHCNKKTPMNAHLHSFNKSNIGQYLPNNIKNIKSYRINNFILIKLRFHLLIDLFPLKIWNFFDKVANIFYKKSYRFILIFDK